MKVQKKLPKGWGQDKSIKRKLSMREKIKRLETRRDQLIDHNMPHRATEIENQIRALKREVELS